MPLNILKENSTRSKIVSVVASGGLVAGIVVIFSANAQTTTYTLTVTKDGANGSLSTNTVSGAGTYTSGSTVTVTAAADATSQLDNWSSGCASANISSDGSSGWCTVQMTASKTVTASFKSKTTSTATYTLTVNKSSTPSGSLSTNTVTGAGTYTSGSTVTVTAAADATSQLDNWSSGCASANISSDGSSGWCTVQMTASKTVTASFKSKTTSTATYTLTVNKSSTPSGSLSTNTVTGAGTYTSGSTVTVTAAADATSQLDNWSSGCASANISSDGSSGWCTVQMTASKTVTATFKTKTTSTATYTLTVNKSSTPSGSTANGTVTGAGTYTSGSTVTVTAAADSSSQLDNWSSGCASANISSDGSSGWCTVQMTASKTVTASFKSKTSSTNYVLTVSKQSVNGGNGTVTISPTTATSCGYGCFNYPAGERVILVASPNSGSTFSGWSGDCVGLGLTCNVTMSLAKNVIATFSAGTTTGGGGTPAGFFNLSVTKQGSGVGTVRSFPTGIDCGTACDDDFDSGDNVILTVLADDSSIFSGWGGDCSGTGITCTVSMTATKTVTASFDTKEISGPSNPQLKTLTVSKDGPGVGGVVYSSPRGIACGTVSSVPNGINIGPFNPFPCTASFTAGTYLTLNALPGPMSFISGWGGCNNQSVYPDGSGWCLVRIDPDQTNQEVVANFEVDVAGIIRTAGGIVGALNAKTVEVNVSGGGQGKVWSNVSRLTGGMISCEPDCSQDF